MSSRKKKTWLENTEVEAIRSAGEIQAILVENGAKRIETLYDKGKISGMSFVMEVSGKDVNYRMPARVTALYERLHASRNSWDRDKWTEYDKAKAERVAWRQLFYWIRAQLVMIDTGMVHPAEPFTPYMYDYKQEKTLFEMYGAKLALGTGTGTSVPVDAEFVED